MAVGPTAERPATPDAQARVRARTMAAFELEQQGRIAYDRRARSLTPTG